MLHSLKLSLFLFSILSPGLQISSIPAQGSPPMGLELNTAVFDSLTSSIIIVGGYSTLTTSDTSALYTFSLSSQQWGEIVPESEFVPSGMQKHFSYLTSQRVILNFLGTSNSRYVSDVLAFDLNTSRWSTVVLSGDLITGRSYFLACGFEQNGTEFIAVYGGFTQSGYDNSLYL
jgi:hypothetical protein